MLYTIKFMNLFNLFFKYWITINTCVPICRPSSIHSPPPRLIYASIIYDVPKLQCLFCLITTSNASIVCVFSFIKLKTIKSILQNIVKQGCLNSLCFWDQQKSIKNTLLKELDFNYVTDDFHYKMQKIFLLSVFF